MCFSEHMLYINKAYYFCSFWDTEWDFFCWVFIIKFNTKKLLCSEFCLQTAERSEAPKAAALRLSAPAAVTEVGAASAREDQNRNSETRWYSKFLLLHFYFVTLSLTLQKVHKSSRCFLILEVPYYVHVQIFIFQSGAV